MSFAEYLLHMRELVTLLPEYYNHFDDAYLRQLMRRGNIALTGLMPISPRWPRKEAVSSLPDA